MMFAMNISGGAAPSHPGIDSLRNGHCLHGALVKGRCGALSGVAAASAAGMAALEKKLGPTGAARLVSEFFKVARDVAFKHDAILDYPRIDAAQTAEDAPAPSHTSTGIAVGSP